jgi:hypothetical protein
MTRQYRKVTDETKEKIIALHVKGVKNIDIVQEVEGLTMSHLTHILQRHNGTGFYKDKPLKKPEERKENARTTNRIEKMLDALVKGLGEDALKDVKKCAEFLHGEGFTIKNVNKNL